MTSLDVIRGAVRVPRPHVVVGVHLKSLRANCAGAELVEPLVEAIGNLAGSVALRVTAHSELERRSDARACDTVAALRRAERAGAEVVFTEPLSDAEFEEYLRGIDISVLPHRWGTHSGWLEQCLDLGVVPVAPRVGRLEDQGARHQYQWRDGRADETSLRAALAGASDEARAGRDLAACARWAERRLVSDTRSARLHEALYRSLIVPPQETMRRRGRFT